MSRSEDNLSKFPSIKPTLRSSLSTELPRCLILSPCLGSNDEKFTRAMFGIRHELLLLRFRASEGAICGVTDDAIIAQAYDLTAG